MFSKLPMLLRKLLSQVSLSGMLCVFLPGFVAVLSADFYRLSVPSQ